MAEQTPAGDPPGWRDTTTKDVPLSTIDRLRLELAAIDREIQNAERGVGIYPISTRTALARLRAQRHDVLVNLAAWEDAGT